MIRAAVILAFVGGGMTAALSEQAPVPTQSTPAFEVASIKLRTGDPAPYVPESPDRFVDPDATLSSLIEYAYDVRDFQVIGGAGWVRSDRFDVSAKAATVVSDEQMRLMMQRLIAERFRLKTHVESREMPVYALVMARTDGLSGKRLRQSAVDCAVVRSARSGDAPARAPGELPPTCSWRVAITGGSAHLVLDGAPISQLTKLVERMVRRVVVDGTGLSGTWDIQLEFAADQLNTRVPLTPDAPVATAREGLSIFTALEEQLGLRLQSRRGGVPVVLIDSGERPTPD
jgi:uncharacterized protein (TIGR03435 family)